MMAEESGRIAFGDRAAHEPGQSPLSRPSGEHPLRVIDMFAGIGGFSLGLHRTGGFQTVAVAELDPYASKVLALHFPNAPNVGDVTKAEYPDADFICAGFPCQDISNAGKRAGITGARSGLWREVVRAIRVVRPRGVLLENVAALLGRGMGRVLGDLAEERHDAEWHCIPASAVGAPHIRDRVWIYAEPQHPDTDRTGSHRTQEFLDREGKPAHEQVCVVGSLGALLADAKSERCGEEGQHSQRQAKRTAGRSEVLAYADDERLPERKLQPGSEGGERRAFPREVSALGGWWPTEPSVGRVAHGVPARVDRLRCLGNAVVPQIPELIGRAILAAQGTEARRAETGNTDSVHDGPVAKPCAQDRRAA